MCVSNGFIKLLHKEPAVQATASPGSRFIGMLAKPTSDTTADAACTTAGKQIL